MYKNEFEKNYPPVIDAFREAIFVQNLLLGVLDNMLKAIQFFSPIFKIILFLVMQIDLLYC